MSASSVLDAARARLEGAPQEVLGEFVIPRRMFGVGRAPRIVRRGSAWHLGVLLLADDAVYSTGDIVRARREVRRGFAAESQRRRAEFAAAAFRGGIDEGAVVHIGWRELDPDAVDRGEPSGPLSLRGGDPSIRWSATGGDIALAGYLDERIELLLHPPGGA